MRRVLTWWTVIVLAGCSGTEGGKVSFFKSGKKNYFMGVVALKKENYVDALKYFNFVKQHYDHYDRYYVLADIRIGDCYFYQEKYTEAIEQYRLFLKLQPRDANAPYVRFRVGESYYRQIPDDWWFMPPSHEKDQSAVMDALRELRAYANRHPRHKYTPLAKKFINKCRKKLYRHELYVAEYYRKKGHHRGAVGRLEGIMTSYGDIATDTNMFHLGESYFKAGLHAEAQKTLARLVDKYPDSRHRDEAKRYLSRIESGE